MTEDEDRLIAANRTLVSDSVNVVIFQPSLMSNPGDKAQAANSAQQGQKPPSPSIRASRRVVTSLLDAMHDGDEYGSIVDCVPSNLDVSVELGRAINDIQAIRHRPLLLYVANVVHPMPGIEIDLKDDLPFSEMVSTVPPTNTDVDIFLVTPGGIAQQVAQFVNRLRPRFTNVSFILPYMAMSAGTIWALSGNEIWMDERAFLGPIDPQVPGKDGRLVPAQAILVLLKKIQDSGQANVAQGRSPDWTDIQLLNNMDPKEIGNTLSLSSYSTQLATTYLERYKFRDWITHTNGNPVQPEERHAVADAAAKKLCSHEFWKVHSNSINRDTAYSELKIKIDRPESIEGFNRAIRRLWALCYFIFDTVPLVKILKAEHYNIFKAHSAGGS